jgi:hypothetical protein
MEKVHVGFAMDKVALGQTSPLLLLFRTNTQYPHAMLLSSMLYDLSKRESLNKTLLTSEKTTLAEKIHRRKVDTWKTKERMEERNRWNQQ